MTNRLEYKEALGRLDKDTRVCIKYLENLINDKFNVALRVQQPSPMVDLSNIESKLDSLQKQIDGFRPKIEAGYTLSLKHDEQEKYLNTLAKKAELVFDELGKHFNELYNSGYYSEGVKRKIRDDGLFRSKRE